MKTLAIFLVGVVAVASSLTIVAPNLGFGAQGQNAAASPNTAAAGGVQKTAGAGMPGAAGAGTAGAGAGPGFIDYGPKVYGMGAKNPLAFPPNPFTIQRAVAIANNVNGVLVRLDTNGEVTLTNQYGQEVEVVDALGREIEYEF